MMSDRFKNRVFIITGAGGGIGGGVARRLSQEAASLVLADINADSLRALAAQMPTTSVRPELLVLDARDPELGKRLGDAAISRFGRIDGFVPLAGIIKIKPLLELDPPQWDLVMGINLRSVFFSIQAIGKLMIERGWTGSIIATSSISGSGPRPDQADYAASKAAINHITKTFALAFAPHGIRVNAISPGVIETPMWQEIDNTRSAMLGVKPGAVLKKFREEIPMGRVGTPDDISAVVAFLLSDESSYITGQIVTIDGGFQLKHP